MSSHKRHQHLGFNHIHHVSKHDTPTRKTNEDATRINQTEVGSLRHGSDPKCLAGNPWSCVPPSRDLTL
eukprot:436009-Amphidinium_carterae.1